MKARYALVAGLVLVLLGAVSIVTSADTGEITANITTVMNVTFTDTLALGTLTGDYDGITENKYLELLVESNSDYYVQLSCDGNMGRVGMADDWRNEIETEYAIWKQITWHDYHTGADGPYSGYVQDDPFKWISEATPVWFNAEKGGGKQGGHGETNDFNFNGGYLPEHDADVCDPSCPPSWPAWWDENIYNYGADLMLEFYPYLDLYDDYGTIAGAFDATITVVITAVPTQ